MAEFLCRKCGKRYKYTLNVWRCNACLSPLDIIWERPSFDIRRVNDRLPGIWKFRDFLPPTNNTVSLGEGYTPVVNKIIHGKTVYFKLDYLMPSGSFKDRGAALTASRLLDLGVKRVVEDSSGNAAISLALYLSTIGIEIEVHGPIDMPEGKVDILTSLNAIIFLGGSRSEAHLRAINREYPYIGHLYNPFFLEAFSTIPYEIYTQLNGQMPKNFVIPIGSGTSLIGVYRGIRHLVESGLLDDNEVKIIGVEAAGYEEVYESIYGHSSGKAKTELADGLRVLNKPRINEVIRIIKKYGDVVVVDEEQIIRALNTLWRAGYLIEPTTATSYAGFLEANNRGLLEGDSVLIILTGSGLKLLDLINRLIIY